MCLLDTDKYQLFLIRHIYLYMYYIVWWTIQKHTLHPDYRKLCHSIYTYSLTYKHMQNWFKIKISTFLRCLTDNTYDIVE